MYINMNHASTLKRIPAQLPEDELVAGALYSMA